MITVWFDYPLLAAFLLDALLGDPRWLPHPIRWFGIIIGYCEKRLNKNKHRRLKGTVLTLVLTSGVWFSFAGVSQWLHPFPFGYYSFVIISTFFGLANHSLIAEALAVEKTLKRNGLDAGRKRLSMIVGRDTSCLDENQIRTAVLETLAENLSDGVIAPLFYYALGGVPLLFVYKMVNTLDSMIGYKSERYRQFGWFSARTDDVFNFVPARLTALLMVIVTFRWDVVPFVLKYGRYHASPNSGYPEAALAGILRCRFGGPNVYHGVVVSKPFIGDRCRVITSLDVYKACRINFAVSLLGVGLIILLSVFLF